MIQPQTFAYLQGISTNVQDKRYALERDVVIIGRGTTSQIRLEDPKVSRQHARIRFNHGVVTLEDLKSSHGTQVNGQPVSLTELRDGDELTLGDTRLRFESTPDAVATVMADELREEGMIACSKCGKEVASNLRFCGRCGQPLHASVPPSPPIPAAKPIPQAPVTPSPMPQAMPSSVAHVTAEKEGKRRWLPFLIGLGIPVALGVAGILVLVLLGVFDEQPFPEQERDLPAVALPTIEEERPEPSDVAPFEFRAFDPDLDGNLPSQTDLAVYSETDTENVALYEIPISIGQEFVLDYFYCGTSESLLVDISESIQITFEIDGVLFTQETLWRETLLRETRACYVYQGVLGDLTPGEHTLVQTMSVKEQIYDGWETWGPEDLVSQIHIHVEG